MFRVSLALLWGKHASPLPHVKWVSIPTLPFAQLPGKTQTSPLVARSAGAVYWIFSGNHLLGMRPNSQPSSPPESGRI